MKNGKNNNWQYQLPTESVTALCEGECNDACYLHTKKYFIAEYNAHWKYPKWVYGKGQNECKVIRWIDLKDLI